MYLDMNTLGSSSHSAGRHPNRRGAARFRRVLMSRQPRRTTRPAGRSAILLIFLLCLAARPLLAELPMARLLTIFPPGAKAGITLEVSVTGTDLDDPGSFWFSSSNITAIPKPGEPGRFVLTVSSNTAPGLYDARFTGRFGVSNPRAFVVGDSPEALEKDGNHAMDTAMEVPLGTVVNARAEASAVDFYKFALKKGQRVLAECAAKAVDSRMDAALILYDSAGHELERSRMGGVIDFTASADGQCFLKVHDALFRGGAEYFYRLSINTGPRIDFVFPPAGLPGTRGKYVLYGRNLPGGTPAKRPMDEDGVAAASDPLMLDGKPLEQLEVEIELPPVDVKRGSVAGSEAQSIDVAEGVKLWRSEAAVSPRLDVDGFEYRLQTPAGFSNPILISFATAPVVPEQEPAGQRGRGQKLLPPCEVAGAFSPDGGRDRFDFEAKKGEVYWAEVFSQRLGLPTSPFMLVQRIAAPKDGPEKLADIQEVYASENNIGGADFKTSALDPSWRFEVKEDGTYRIQLQDLFGLGQSNPSHAYRLSLRRESPDFRLAVLAPAPAPAKKDAREAHFWSGFLRQGETIPLKVLALRRDNFNGEIQLGIEGLPEGVSVSETRIDAGKNSALLLLTASNHLPARVSTMPVRIFGKAVPAANQEIVREARGGTVVWNVPDFNLEPVQSRLTRGMVLAVSGEETAPISITAAETDAPAPSSKEKKSKTEGGALGSHHPGIREAKPGAKVRIPLRVARHGDFTETLKLKVTGIPALEAMKEFEVDAKTTNAVLELDLAQYKVPPGLHTFYLLAQTKGKYRNNPEAAEAAKLAAKEAEKTANDLSAAAKQATSALAAATDKAEAEKTASEASAKAKEAEAQKTTLAARAKELAEKAKAKEVTLTVYSAPIQLKVLPEEKKVAAGDKK